MLFPLSLCLKFFNNKNFLSPNFLFVSKAVNSQRTGIVIIKIFKKENKLEIFTLSHTYVFKVLKRDSQTELG